MTVSTFFGKSSRFGSRVGKDIIKIAL